MPKSALRLDDVPGKLLVVGAGYIGLEMSVIYNALGSDIRIIEMTPSILPGVDRDLARVFHERTERSHGTGIFRDKGEHVIAEERKDRSHIRR